MSKRSETPIRISLALLILAYLFLAGTPRAFAQAGAWATAQPMPTPRHAMGVAVVNGILYAISGTTSASTTGTDTPVVEAYDPAAGTWSTKAPIPTPRHAFGTGVVNGIIYIVGGYAFASNDDVKTVEAYDPVSNTWSRKADVPTIRDSTAAAALNGILYVVGGGNTGTTVEAYDPVSDTWSTKQPMNTPRISPAADAINGVLYVVGGANNISGSLSSIEAYDPGSDTWSTKASIATPRWGLGAGAIYGRLYAAGGYPDLQAFEAYDPVDNSTAAELPMPTGRDPAVAVLNGVLYAVGGFDRNSNTPLSTVEYYTPPPPPVFTSASSTTFIVGSAGSFTVTATGNPTPTLFESGALPNGVSFNAATGALSGTPAAGTTGAYNLTFTARNGSDTSQNFTLTVIALQSIAVTPVNPSLQKSLTLQFTATGTYSDSSTRDITSSVTWSSSKPTCATITSAGLATAVAQGTTTIQATQGISGSTVLTVTAPPLTSISVTPTTATIATGGTQQFAATGTYGDGTVKTITTSVTWTSSNTAAATISSGGLASGAGVGSTTIRATIGNVSGTASLTVQPTLVSIAISPLNPSVTVGSTIQFTATGHYSDNSTQNLTNSVVWTSNKTNVATINSSGLATGIAKGNVTIKAKSGGIVAQTTLTVN